MSVFICYSNKDSEFAEKLAFDLTKENVHVWIDKWRLNVGDSLLQKIQEAISECSVLLVLLSQQSVESEWCKKELNAGLIRELEEKRVVVLPVLLEECKIPIFLREKLYADFRQQYNIAFNKLYNSLLKYTSITLGQVKTTKYIVDFGMDYGLDNNKNYYLRLDSISYAKGLEYSILSCLKFIGNKKITHDFKQYCSINLNWHYQSIIFEIAYEFSRKNEMKFIIEDNKPICNSVILNDKKTNSVITMNYSIRRLGIDNGFDLLFDLNDLFGKLRETLRLQSRKLTQAESKALFSLLKDKYNL